MEFSSRRFLVCLVVVVGLSVELSLAGTSVGTGKQLSGASNSIKTAESTERGGWGYPTGYSLVNGASSFGLPLVFIPLIYFGVLWCVLLFGLAAFHHAPLHHHGHKSHGHHHRYRRYDDFEDDYSHMSQQQQQHILSSI